MRQCPFCNKYRFTGWRSFRNWIENFRNEIGMTPEPITICVVPMPQQVIACPDLCNVDMDFYSKEVPEKTVLC